MKDEIDTLRALFRSEADYQRAEQWWARLWSTIPKSSSWTRPWLNTAAADGNPGLDGDGILSAINTDLHRGFKVIHKEDGSRGWLTWWKQVWDPDYDNMPMLVLVIVPSVESVQAAKSLLSAWAKGDHVDDAGELRWNDDGEGPS